MGLTLRNLFISFLYVSLICFINKVFSFSINSGMSSSLSFNAFILFNKFVVKDSKYSSLANSFSSFSRSSWAFWASRAFRAFVLATKPLKIALPPSISTISPPLMYLNPFKSFPVLPLIPCCFLTSDLLRSVFSSFGILFIYIYIYLYIFIYIYIFFEIV